jgi:hypothetical protein
MNRRAASLIELLLAMSACTVILTMSVALIHRIMHVQSKTRAIDDGERAALRLSEHFRRDVHAAASAEADSANLAGGAVLRLKLSGRRSIEYRHAEGTVVRVLLDGEDTGGREQFSFPGDIELTVRDESPGLVTLSITSPRPDSQVKPGEERQSTAVGPISLEATARLNCFAETGAVQAEATEP